MRAIAGSLVVFSGVVLWSAALIAQGIGGRFTDSQFIAMWASAFVVGVGLFFCFAAERQYQEPPPRSPLPPDERFTVH